MVDAAGVRWYLSPVSPLNLTLNEIMTYDLASPSYSRPDAKYFLVPWRLSNKILCPLNDPSIPITKAALVMMYYIWFRPYCTWDHYSNTLRASKRIVTLKDKLLLVTCPIIIKHPIEKISNHYDWVGDLYRLPARVSFPNAPWVCLSLHWWPIAIDMCNPKFINGVILYETSIVSRI